MTHSAPPARSERRCGKCGEIKPLDEFYKNQYRCKPCHKAYYKEWNKANEAKRHSYHTRRRYGVDQTEYNRMFEEQGGRCKICNQEQPEKRLAVDHCHRTGKVRSLLCDPCNKAIGLLKDNPSLLRSAANYVELFESHVP